MSKKLPLIYSCSGCSSAAQLANDLALELDREKVVEMSCIAGLGGDVPALVRVAKSGRAVVLIDGCALQCGFHCLKRHGVTAQCRFTLSELNVPKTFHQRYSIEDFGRLKLIILDSLKSLTSKET